MLRKLILKRVDSIVARARADRKYLEAIQRHVEGNKPVMRQIRRLLFDLVMAAFAIVYIVLRMVLRNVEACAVLSLAAALYMFLCV
ncbi:hypothetical protein SePPVgORF038 [Seal parapoxvirus]|uniref:Uncharacterized protein n=1 Tax=Seal parapoxvirus TaxID=187984 RepID=A0A1Z4CGG9_9POXV|nr:hypothetical protein CGV03_gp038 [Seal parapoxvirus]ASF89966.1 hypothetical protein SePPVgORF038 [Seal parapoxvirus]